MFMPVQILVFRTNIRSITKALRVCNNLLNAGLVFKATIDMSDCDRVLRVVTQRATNHDIEQAVKAMGVSIDELL